MSWRASVIVMREEEEEGAMCDTDSDIRVTSLASDWSLAPGPGLWLADGDDTARPLATHTWASRHWPAGPGLGLMLTTRCLSIAVNTRVNIGVRTNRWSGGKRDFSFAWSDGAILPRQLRNGIKVLSYLVYSGGKTWEILVTNNRPKPLIISELILLFDIVVSIPPSRALI